MTLLACVEVGGSGCQTVVFDGDDAWRLLDGAHRPAGADLAIATPGLVEGGRVLVASNLGWYDVDPAHELGLEGPASVLLNDAEAAALGEAALRAPGGGADLVFIGVGTGVGGATVHAGAVVAANLFGHATGFSEVTCRCGRVGCLETVAAGWALPPVLDAARLGLIARALAAAIEREQTATAELVVLAGGLTRANPALVAALRAELPERRVEPSAAPTGAKSASAWGLRHVVELTSPQS